MSKRTSSSGHKIGLRLGAGPDRDGAERAGDRLRAYRDLLLNATATSDAPPVPKAHRSAQGHEPSRKYDSSR